MSDEPTRVELVRKPKKCPRCGKAPVASILYGFPNPSDKLFQGMKDGTITLGGCVISDDDPAWECTHCGLMIFRQKKQ